MAETTVPAAMWFSCPYCAERIYVTAGNVTRVVGESGVDELAQFTVTFLTRHARCQQRVKADG